MVHLLKRSILGVWVLAVVLSLTIGFSVAEAQPKININTAPIEMLQSLPGIGPALADRIVAYRTETPFKTIEDMKQVSGIGEATFEKIKDLITTE